MNLLNARKYLHPLFLTVSLLVFIFLYAGPVQAAVYSGTDGSLKWEFNTSNKTLTISGTGDISYNYDEPFQTYRSEITNLVVKNGITGIHGDSFSQYSALRKVTLADSVTDLGAGCFHDCLDLSAFKMSGNTTINFDVEWIDDYTTEDVGTFTGCDRWKLVFDTPLGSSAGKELRQRDFMVKGDETIPLDTAYVELLSEPKYCDEYNDEEFIFGEYKYTGKAIKPVPVVQLYGKTLKKGTDFTVSYKNNKNVGEARCIIKGIGKCSGSNWFRFAIYPKGTSLKKIKTAKKALRIYWKQVKTPMAKKRINGYEIQIARNKKFTKSVKTVTVKGWKKTAAKIKKLKSGKTYYVRIRTFKNIGGQFGTYYYSRWSKVLKKKAG